MASAKGIFTGSQLPDTLKHLSALGLAGSTDMRGEPDGPQLQSQPCPSVAVPPTAAVRSGQVVPDPPLGETVREPGTILTLRNWFCCHHHPKKGGSNERTNTETTCSRCTGITEKLQKSCASRHLVPCSKLQSSFILLVKN